MRSIGRKPYVKSYAAWSQVSLSRVSRIVYKCGKLKHTPLFLSERQILQRATETYCKVQQ